MSDPMSKIDSYLNHAITSSEALRPAGDPAAESHESMAPADTLRIPVLLRIDPAKFDPDRIPGLALNCVLGEVAAGTVSPESLRILNADPAVIAVEASRAGLIDELAFSVPFARGDAVHRPPVSETGASAIVAVVDDGIDVLHECFKDAAGASRIEAIWDQTDPTGPTPASVGYPAGLNFGTLHTNSDIARYLAANAVPARLGRNPNGHGTHVASIAAGRAAGNFAGGMAPDARIVVVRPTLQITPGDVLSIGYSVSHAAALTFIDHIAGLLNKPVAVNVSLGMNAGGHDGSSLLEAAFDGFSTGGRKPGRVIIKSAGNERGQNGHASLDLPSNALEVLKWESVQPHRGPDNIELWFHSSDDMQFRLIGPGGGVPSPWVQFAAAPTITGRLSSGERFEMTLDRYFRDNGDSRLLITLNGNPTIATGTFSLEIQTGAIRSAGRLDAWIERTPLRPIRFVNHLDDEVTLSVPGTARTVVAVASVGSGLPVTSSVFSSKGPCRDKRDKPELSAPGDNIAAAAGGTASGTVSMSGTSMAAPHVTGAVALLFSRCASTNLPIPNAMQVSAALRGTTQNFNGRHTPTVGYGVLDTMALIRAF